MPGNWAGEHSTSRWKPAISVRPRFMSDTNSGLILGLDLPHSLETGREWKPASFEAAE
jgi:hypothetical protein